VAEMSACRWANQQEGHTTEVYGIVSNGQSWQFYRLAVTGEIFQTDVYTTKFLPELLAALHYACAQCASNVG
jgi:hypothetical protein